MELTSHTAKQIEQLPRYLHAEFPNAPIGVIEHDIEDRVHDLITSAHFDDFVPLLVHRSHPRATPRRQLNSASP